jgi:hypothetical protein
MLPLIKHWCRGAVDGLLSIQKMHTKPTPRMGGPAKKHRLVSIMITLQLLRGISNPERFNIYLLTPQGIEHKTMLMKCFLKCKQQEYEKLRVEIEALSAEVGPVGCKN